MQEVKNRSIHGEEASSHLLVVQRYYHYAILVAVSIAPLIFFNDARQFALPNLYLGVLTLFVLGFFALRYYDALCLAKSLKKENQAISETLSNVSNDLKSKTDALDRYKTQRLSAENSAAELANELRVANEKLTQDIRQTKGHEEALTSQALTMLNSELQLRTIIDNTFDAIITTDREGLILTANSAACRLFDRDKLQLIGRKLPVFIPNFSLELADTGRQALEAVGEETTLPISLAMASMSLKGEQRFVCVIRNETDAVRAQEALIREKEAAELANKAKSEFLSSMSHELRTPMNAILGFAQLLQSDGTLDKTQSKSLDQILKAGWHLLELINEVLDLAKIEAGRIDPNYTQVSINTLIWDAVRLIQPLADQHEISLKPFLDDKEIMVRSDAIRLKQVILNLLSNAVKYNRKGGFITINCEVRNDSHCHLSIRDTGLGLSEQQMIDVFNPFTRVAKNQYDIEGTGIGLTISQKILHAMCGEIGVESELGKGSVFWVEVPLFKQPSSNEVLDVSDGSEYVALDNGQIDIVTDAKTLLYIEDNPDNVSLVENILKRRRPDICLSSVHTGELGVAQAKRIRPDLVLADIGLPGINGFQVVEALRADESLGEIPVCAVSANAMPSDVKKGLDSGFDYYLTKPINIGEFLKVIDQYVM